MNVGEEGKREQIGGREAGGEANCKRAVAVAKQHYQRRLLVRSLVLPILAREGCCCCCCEAANLGIGIGSTKLESSQSSSSSSSVVLVVVVDVVVVAVVAVPPVGPNAFELFPSAPGELIQCILVGCSVRSIWFCCSLSMHSFGLL